MNKPVTALTPDVTASPAVFGAIAGVMEDLAKAGIEKASRNTQQGYNFRGIDDVYNALAPVLAKHRLIITPRCLDRQKEVVATAKGGTLFYVTVDMEFTLASAEDGSEITARMFGEAMDSGDKATNKAMSAAYKYMAMQTFCIPTQGDNDADATSHQLASAEEMAVNLLRGCGSKELFVDAWNKNKDGWRKVMEGPAYARVVAEMKRLAAAFPKDEPQPQPEAAAEDFGLGDDEIPF
jgi:hypothetical protein